MDSRAWSWRIEMQFLEIIYIIGMLNVVAVMFVVVVVAEDGNASSLMSMPATKRDLIGNVTAERRWTSSPLEDVSLTGDAGGEKADGATGEKGSHDNGGYLLFLLRYQRGKAADRDADRSRIREAADRECGDRFRSSVYSALLLELAQPLISD